MGQKINPIIYRIGYNKHWNMWKHPRNVLQVLISNDNLYLNKAIEARAVAKYIGDHYVKGLLRINTSGLIKYISQYSPYLTGYKVKISGRINGVEMARNWTKSNGTLSLQRIISKIDYAYYPALTKYGIIGIKVWLGFK